MEPKNLNSSRWAPLSIWAKYISRIRRVVTYQMQHVYGDDTWWIALDGIGEIDNNYDII